MEYYTLVLVLVSIFTLSFLCTLTKLSSRGSKRLPPGPSPWPIIGNLHLLLGAKPHRSIANLAQIYGPIMSLKLGQLTIVVISSSTIAKQVLQKQDLAFSSRFIADALQSHNHCKFSMACLPVCPQWRTLRRILNTYLLSSNRLDANQHLRSQKVKELLAYCDKCSQESEAVDVGQAVFKTNFNLMSNTLFSQDLSQPFSDSKVELKDVICGIIDVAGMINLVDIFPILGKIDPQRIRYCTNILFSKMFNLCGDLINERLEEKKRNHNEKSDVLEVFLNHNAENPEEINQNHIKSMLLVELKEVIWGIMAEVGKPNLVDFFPILEKIDLQRIKHRATIHFGKLFKLFDGLINERLEDERRFHSERNDVLEAFLNISEENPKEIDHNHIKSMFVDLFGAGTDTTTSTLEWAMAEIFKQPEIMKKAQVEFVEIIGKGKPIEEDDVSRLPYLQCIIKETLRMHPPVPFLVPRKVEQDVELCDYIIPKGSQVLVNVWMVGRDSTFWEDPLMFKPERFLSSNLDMRGQDFELIPFGAGRRICPGLPLALRMVPIMLGSLLNSFNWKLKGPEDLDMEEKFGITLAKARPLRAIPSPL